MSWTSSCTESNTFKVKNIKEVRQVLELMGFCIESKDNEVTIYTSGEGTWFDEETEVVLSIKPIKLESEEEPTNLIGIISDYACEPIDLDDIPFGLDKDKDVMVVPIVEYLQDQLLDEKSAIVITTAGFEGRCSGDNSPFGDVTLITKCDCESTSLFHWTNQMAEKLGVTV